MFSIVAATTIALRIITTTSPITQLSIILLVDGLDGHGVKHTEQCKTSGMSLFTLTFKMITNSCYENGNFKPASTGTLKEEKNDNCGACVP